MNAHSPPPFTPAQVLEAARRAESEGRDEYALQFYRHLANNFPDTPEGAAAQSALMRLAAAPTFGGQQPPAPSSYGLGNPFAAAPGADFGPGGYPEPARPSLNSPSSNSASTGGVAMHSASSAAATHSAIEMPRAVRDYRTGRLLARLLTWLGGVMILLGIVLVPLTLLGPKALTGLPLIGALLATGPKLGLQLAVAGIVQMVLGQLVRALLDLANATRDMAAIARAEAEARNPAEPKTGRRRRR